MSLNLEDEILQALEVLSRNDRDIKSIAIWCNPNYSRGGDSEVRKEVRSILTKLKKEGRVSTEKVRVNLDIKGKKTFTVWKINTD